MVSRVAACAAAGWLLASVSAVDQSFRLAPGSAICSVTSTIGCYHDNIRGRVLPNKVAVHVTDLTREGCAAMVAVAVGAENVDKVIVGVEYGNQCFYGQDVPANASHAPTSDCNQTCTGNATETCGSYDRIFLFHAHCVEPPPPPTPPPPPLPDNGPCDILDAAGNPCVAAHSTVRALYKAYDGPLYNVTRPNGESKNIGVVKPGGFADVATHDDFCRYGDCVISNVFDQSPMKNHLGQRHKLVNASQHKILVGPDRTSVYGMWFDPGYGYHVDQTQGIATGNDPESMYAVMSGTHYNGACCFDYGNSETDDHSDGAGTMEAIYFGNAHWQGNTGSGSTGPWVGADLECGMYYGGGNATKVNNQSKPLPFPFVSLHLKGRVDGFALKGGDASTGAFMTMYDGPRPDCAIAGTCHRHGNHTYQPMSKKGAIILATGGDNSNGAMGKFYEGYMVTGVTTDATDDAVQANIVAVGYRTLI